MTASFRVERVTQTKDGRDVDDASPSVMLAVGDRTLSAGGAMGQCGPPERAGAPFIRETCTASAPAGTMLTLACGDDPHVDAFACIYAVRTRQAVELWRQDVEFTVTDDAPLKVSPRSLARLGTLPVGASTELRAGAMQYREVAR